MKKIFSLFVFALASQFIMAQGVGEWRSHLPLHKGTSVCKAGSKVYVAAYPSVFVYDTEDESITQLSKVNELSDLGANVLRYSPSHNTVVIGYETGNIDLIVNNQVINVPDIARSFIQGNKSINNISIKGDFAYLSTGFGIVVLDIQRKEIKETYTIGDNGTYVDVYDFEIYQDTIFAPSIDGIYYAPLNGVNLSDFQVWNLKTFVPSGVEIIAAESSGDALFLAGKTPANDQDTLYRYQNGILDVPAIPDLGNSEIKNLNFENNQLIVSNTYGGKIIDNDLSKLSKVFTYGSSYSGVQPRDFYAEGGVYYIADETHGLAIRKGTWDHEVITPEGPGSENCWDLNYANGAMWVASGSVQYNLNNFWQKNGVYQFKDNVWKSYDDKGVDSIYDIVSIATNPNNPDHVFFGSWGKGMGELKNGNFSHYYSWNSPIDRIPAYNWQAIGGLAFDKNGWLWIVNSPKNSSPLDYPLLAFDGTTWHQFNMKGAASTGFYLNKIFIDNNGYKWIVTRSNGIIVFDDNGTLTDDSDDRVIRLKEGSGNGSLASNEVHSLVIDDNDKVWIGTEKGLSVIHSTTDLFEGGVEAERIIIEQNGSAQYLLETDAIRSIVKDGGNRKWVATFSGGVYLISEDGQETIHHFTTDNSPLLSNNVIDVEVFGNTGEVFFATEKGLISYLGDATSSEDYTGPVYAFPNPVRSGYEGKIGIRGLVGNSEVKITDITGNIVFETMAEGGMATWDGKSINGDRVQTGVYIVFSSNDDGSKTEVAKILFIN